MNVVRHALTHTGPRRPWWWLVTAILLIAAGVGAQERAERTAVVPGLIRAVALDPTTYAPAMFTWNAMRLDWNSSQVFFNNGWLEHNSRFTASGRSDDIAVTYADGKRRIVTDSLSMLKVSAINNMSARLTERLLLSRYPQHRKMIGAVGWIERSAMASYWSYRISAGHLRQWQENDRRALELGYK